MPIRVRHARPVSLPIARNIVYYELVAYTIPAWTGGATRFTVYKALTPGLRCSGRAYCPFHAVHYRHCHYRTHCD